MRRCGWNDFASSEQALESKKAAFLAAFFIPVMFRDYAFFIPNQQLNAMVMRSSSP